MNSSRLISRIAYRVFRITLPFIVLALTATAVPVVRAAEISQETRQAVVWVHCGKQQGSGVVINSEKGYVLTNAHVLLDEQTDEPKSCEVGLVKPGETEPSSYYNANWERYVFDEQTNRDFAILKIAELNDGAAVPVFYSLKTNEFFKVGDRLAIISYPSSSDGMQVLNMGTINGIEKGMIKTDAAFESGSSGGAGVTTNNGLVGLATGILYEEIAPGQERIIDYELVDIRAVISWLDTFGQNFHDRYVTHLDYDAFHHADQYVQVAALNCSLLARTAESSTVYCLRSSGTRSVFPTSAVYFSWFADFSAVIEIPVDQLADYRLTDNITIKPGSLIKIESDPRVYVVSDNAGTLRWLPNEATAIKLFGQGWAGSVKDIPVTFFQDYQIGTPLPT